MFLRRKADARAVKIRDDMNHIEPVKVTATLEKASTMKDRSIRLTFETQELPADKCGDLFNMRNMLGWLIFAPSTVESIEVPSEPPSEFRNDKTPSKRLRDHIFIWWKQSGAKGDSESFYREKMEKIIASVKEKLE